MQSDGSYRGRNQLTDPARRVGSLAIRLFLVAYALAVLLLLSLFVISSVRGISLKYFTSDPLLLPKPHLYNGFISNIDMMLWSSVVVSCLLTYAVVRQYERPREWARFFLLSGLFSAVLLFDDQYMFHDYVMPDLLHLPQEIVYSTYLLFLIGYLVLSGRTILKTKYWPFIVALAFFAVSVGFDVVQRPVGDMIANESIEYLIDDGSKFLALVGWSGYFLMTTASVLQRAFGRPDS